ncbi:hypothetical protein BH11PAT1_BH11PAT1_5770 [soil metagenome]
MLQPLHINDRKVIASQFHISVEQFDALVNSAHHAYEFLKIMGPFYGQEDNHEPTFRVASEPVRLPVGSQQLLTDFGNDLVRLGRSLPKLPTTYQKLLGNGLDFRIPLTFRIDAILDENEKIRVNEIEGMDGASALMMIEQLTYGLQTFHDTTIGRLISTFHSIFPTQKIIKIAIVRSNITTNHYTANTYRFMEFMHELSKGTVQCELYDLEELKGGVTPAWDQFSVVLNETYFSPEELYKLGIAESQLYASGNFNALVNKGLFALVHERALTSFWKKELGNERFIRIKSLLIPSRFITSEKELDLARKQGKVVKVTWAQDDMSIANRAQGVAIPVGEIVHSSEERWEFLRECIRKGYTVIAQEFVKPTTIQSYLKKKAGLELVDWYNRTCVKFVVAGNPNGKEIPSVNITATEVTLGPDVIPSGRKCSFTAGILA